MRESGGETEQGWGILAFDEKEDDRHIGELLKAAGFIIFHSESTEEFFIDDFGRLKALALDRYRESLEPFDPRDDGYGEKLRNFFVRDGRRYFFVFLPSAKGYNLGDSPGRPFFLSFLGINSQQWYKKKIQSNLGTISFTLEIPGEKTPVLSLVSVVGVRGMYFILAAAAILGAFLLERDSLNKENKENKEKGAWRMRRTSTMAAAPLFLALAWVGSAGFILAGLLAGIRSLLRPVLGEFLPPVYGSTRERLKPYRFYVIPVFLLLVYFGLVSAFFLLSAFSTLFFFFLLDYLSVKAERKSSAQSLFLPVRMLSAPAKFPIFRLLMIPFALGAFLALFAGKTYTDNVMAKRAGQNLSSVSYEEHMAFELSFSQKSLVFPEKSAYTHYYLGEDGLIAGMTEESVPNLSAAEIPPFPLEKLGAFLVECTEQNEESPLETKELIAVLLLLIFCIPNRLGSGNRSGGRKKTVLSHDGRIAA